MLGNKNTNKKTVLGGAGIALLLCALMVGMTMTNLHQAPHPVKKPETAIASEDSEVSSLYQRSTSLHNMNTMKPRNSRE